MFHELILDLLTFHSRHSMSIHSIIINIEPRLLILQNEVAQPVGSAGVGVAWEGGISEWIFVVGGLFVCVVSDR